MPDDLPQPACPRTDQPRILAATETGAAIDADAPIMSALAQLLARHVLRDGELVLLVVKPSRWFIIFQSMRFAAIVGIIISGILLVRGVPTGRTLITYIELTIMLIGARVMIASLQWIARLYVLTDLRILKLSGVVTPVIYDCPLRKIARTRLVYTFRERMLGLGSIEIIPRDENLAFETWQTVRRPAEVHERVVAAINRARSGGGE